MDFGCCSVQSKKLTIAGWVMGLIPVGMLVMSGVMKLMQPPMVVEGFAAMGFPKGIAIPLAIVELGATLLYLIPRSSTIGCILLTGYLGGAICTHVRVSEAFHMPLILGILLWGGLYLRDPRIRTLIPFTRPKA